jgi:hypothetical protein
VIAFVQAPRPQKTWRNKGKSYHCQSHGVALKYCDTCIGTVIGPLDGHGPGHKSEKSHQICFHENNARSEDHEFGEIWTGDNARMFHGHEQIDTFAPWDDSIPRSKIQALGLTPCHRSSLFLDDKKYANLKDWLSRLEIFLFFACSIYNQKVWQDDNSCFPSW